MKIALKDSTILAAFLYTTAILAMAVEDPFLI
jgi:hypothetical protein